MANQQSGQLKLQVVDVSGQKMFQLDDVEPDSTVDELLRRAVPELRMPQNDVAGRPLAYQLRLDREGRHLHSAERVGDATLQQDRLTILPNIDAGATCS
jgi:hypothetical protein